MRTTNSRVLYILEAIDFNFCIRRWRRYREGNVKITSSKIEFQSRETIAPKPLELELYYF